MADFVEHDRDVTIQKPIRYGHRVSEIVCDPAKWPYRYIILALLCYVHAAVMFTIENVGGLSNTVIKVMRIDGKEYELLFSFFTLPGIVVCFFGGILFDRVLGVKLGFTIAIIASIIGELLIAIGAYVNQYSVMLLGRFILGIGTELQIVAMLTYQSIWFHGADRNFAMSLNLSAARLSGSVSLIIMQYIYEWLTFTTNDYYRLGTTLLSGVFVTIGTLIAAVFIILLDYIGEKKKMVVVEVMNYSTKRQISCKDVMLLMSVDLWLVIVAIGVFIPIIFAFTGIGQQYFMQKYGFEIHLASLANSVVFVGVAFVTPFLGVLVSSTGYNVSWGQLGIALGILSHLLYALSAPSDHAVVFISGIIYSQSYSLFVISMLTVPGELVDKTQLSTVYGFTKSVQNLSYLFTCLVTGFLIDYLGYFIFEMFLIFLLCTTFLVLHVLLMRNRRINKSQFDCPKSKKITKRNSISLNTLNNTTLDANSLQTDMTNNNAINDTEL